MLETTEVPSTTTKTLTYIIRDNVQVCSIFVDDENQWTAEFSSYPIPTTVYVVPLTGKKQALQYRDIAIKNKRESEAMRAEAWIDPVDPHDLVEWMTQHDPQLLRHF